MTDTTDDIPYATAHARAAANAADTAVGLVHPDAVASKLVALAQEHGYEIESLTLRWKTQSGLQHGAQSLTYTAGRFDLDGRNRRGTFAL